MGFYNFIMQASRIYTIACAAAAAEAAAADAQKAATNIVQKSREFELEYRQHEKR